MAVNKKKSARKVKSSGQSIQKCIAYKRARFVPPGYNGTLENLLKDALIKLPKADQRVWQTELFKNISNSTFEVDGDFIFMRISEYEPNAKAGTISIEKKRNAKIGAHSAPANSDYINKEGFILVKGNDLLFLSDELGSKSTIAYIQWLLTESSILPEKTKFEIGSIAAKNKLLLIEKHGVTKIDLDITAYLSTFEEIKASGRMSRGLKGLLLKNEDHKSLVKDSNTTAKILVNAGRRSKLITVDENSKPWIEKRAAEIATEEESDYSIILKNGYRISREELTINKKVFFSKKAGRLDEENVRLVLKETYKFFKSLGDLDT